MTNILTYFVMLCHDLILYDILFDVMTTSWHTFWCYDIRFDVMMCFLTSWHILHTYWREYFLTSWRTFLCYMYKIIFVCHDILLWCHDVPFHIMTCFSYYATYFLMAWCTFASGLTFWRYDVFLLQHAFWHHDTLTIIFVIMMFFPYCLTSLHTC